ncbi:MAG TPA: DNA mismatch repair endonuclease MutL [Halococcus sp.]|nr:DNA mismatch repair endonuclease MutL [Halococcus sp.]
MSDTEIRRLDKSTIERIAAGEVVERPASVVKELVENSLDADASRVRVAAERGGKDGIRVTDDGTGMSESAVEKAVEKHTTSKIADITDLEAGVSSLGFRGEALAAIGAVSRLTVRTKPRGASRGTELRMVGGEIETIEPAGCPEGTTVEIEDLFYNVPARRKFLKQDATEFSHTNRVATGYALSNPELALSLSHNDREVFSTTGHGSLEATVLSVYGREVAEAMIPVETDGSGPLDGITGVISHPETTRASPEHCSVFVNGRYVAARAVRDAVVEAYGAQLAPDRYPFVVLFLSLPANAVDVNVHPRKLEVRFADEAGVSEQVRTAVESALIEEGLVRSGAARGQSAPEQTPIEPTHADSRSDDSAESTTATETAHTPNEPMAHGSSDGTTNTDTESPDESTVPVESRESRTNEDRRRTATHPATEPSVSGETEPGEGVTTERKFTEKVEQATLDGESVPDDPEFDRLPRLRVLGQLRDTYVVCESPDGLVLVDQHAADERVNYEHLKERFAGETAIQQLTEPVEIELTAAEAALFEEFENALTELGFRAIRTDERRVAVETVPAVLAGAADPDLLCDVLSAFVRDGKPGDTVEGVADALLSDLACYPSITGNTSLKEGTVLELLSALDACENPYACPHGRPVIIELSQTELEERFERDYPGHAGRRHDAM